MNRRGPVEIDDRKIFAQEFPAGGIAREELAALKPRLIEVRDRIGWMEKEGQIGYRALPDQDVRPILRAARLVRETADDFVVIGIGGSSLGAVALQSALAHPLYNLLPRKARKGPRVFFLENPDPDYLAAVLDALNLRKTAVNVVTKSGGTAETMANFLVIRKVLSKAVGKRHAERIIATTDQDKGDLRAIAREEGYATLPVPANVGGRFSTLTSVGLLPAAVAGIDIRGLLGGAREMRHCTSTASMDTNAAWRLAGILYLADTARGKRTVVFMPYASALREIGFWFRQLWAESLGKARDREGREVHSGQTPIAASGPVDQHSQLQLYMEGPDDKIYIFVRAAKFGKRVPIPRVFPGSKTCALLGGHELGGLMNAEQAATEEALHRTGRPVIRIDLPAVSAHAVGQLLFLLEEATVVAGGLYGIDPFDQPGVELSKVLTKRELEK